MASPYGKHKPKTRREPLPDYVAAAFAHKRYLNLGELAAALGYSVNTLRRFANNGDLPWHLKGLGPRRKFRAFTLDDVTLFWNSTRRQMLDDLNEKRRAHARVPDRPSQTTNRDRHLGKRNGRRAQVNEGSHRR